MPYTRVNDPEKLRRLMGAVLMITADVELADLLSLLVEEARSLVGARYAVLGVLNETRTGLEQFITVGLSDVEERTIGDRPTGRVCWEYSSPNRNPFAWITSKSTRTATGSPRLPADVLVLGGAGARP